MSTLAQAIREYGQAIRGDWSEIDGRSVLMQMEEFASAIEGGEEAEWDLDRWRLSMGVCPDGGGHWGGRWGHCETDDGCPSIRGGVE